jgi:PPK2 family polyphosphate:nucleotide phosphotransferase
MVDRWRVNAQHPVNLAGIDPASTPGVADRPAAEAELSRLHAELGQLQERLWAESRRSLLVVLQAMDTGGKDGTVKHVFSGLNPLGTRVTSFKEPTDLERRHDFLWRIHQAVPAAGEVGIFNRSHYEDVLVVRVHGLVPDGEWQARYKVINDFEEALIQSGTSVLKLFLHISKDEQRRRLQERLSNEEKRWKFRPSDLDDRARWDAFQAAYEDVLRLTSTAGAPWHVIPADHKWYRNWAVSTLIVDTLRALDPQFPEATGWHGVPPTIE